MKDSAYNVSTDNAPITKLDAPMHVPITYSKLQAEELKITFAASKVLFLFVLINNL